MICGLLGEKLGHSYSPEIHRHLGTYSYALFEKRPDELGDFLKNGNFTGLNVTIPYKKTVIPYCDELSPTAQRLGAVNTIVKGPDGRLIGHNTDNYGFTSMLERSGLDPKGKRVLVLGTGGASATVQAVLQSKGAKVTVISRSGVHNYDNMYRFYSTKIIVNATPVGMYPHNGARLVDLSRFSQLEGVLDLIYNPSKTQLLLDAEARNLVAVNGLWMLVAQAKESAEWFLNQSLHDGIIQSTYYTLRNEMENIVLIGMPGCGKSTVGLILAKELSRRFVDTDVEITKKIGMSIPEYFAKFGEKMFRQVETEVISEISKESGLVISTGGGCVTQERNYPLLHQNSRVIWLDRSLWLLPTNGRPLSQQNSVFDLYEQRKPCYMHFADYIVDNNRTPEEAVASIICMEGKI